MDLSLPDKTLVVMVKRNNKYFVPTGKTVLRENDKLLIITDDQDALWLLMSVWASIKAGKIKKTQIKVSGRTI